jgi:hypothetical protein
MKKESFIAGPLAQLCRANPRNDHAIGAEQPHVPCSQAFALVAAADARSTRRAGATSVSFLTTDETAQA